MYKFFVLSFITIIFPFNKFHLNDALKEKYLFLYGILFFETSYQQSYDNTKYHNTWRICKISLKWERYAAEWGLTLTFFLQEFFLVILIIHSRLGDSLTFNIVYLTKSVKLFDSKMKQKQLPTVSNTLEPTQATWICEPLKTIEDYKKLLQEK